MNWYWLIPKFFKRKKMLITKAQLRTIATTMPEDKVAIMSGLFNEFAEKYNVPKESFPAFVGNVVQESGELAHKTENMNYSAKRLLVVWPGRFKTLEAAQPYANNPEKLANLVYGGRMGNTEPGDGWRYRGAGFIGLTGKEMYSKYAKFLGKPEDETADLVRSDDRYALDSAFWFYYVHKNLGKETDFKKIVRGINGGLIGYAVRLKYYELAKRVLV